VGYLYRRETVEGYFELVVPGVLVASDAALQPGKSSRAELSPLCGWHGWQVRLRRRFLRHGRKRFIQAVW